MFQKISLHWMAIKKWSFLWLYLIYDYFLCISYRVFICFDKSCATMFKMCWQNPDKAVQYAPNTGDFFCLMKVDCYVTVESNETVYCSREEENYKERTRKTEKWNKNEKIWEKMKLFFFPFGNVWSSQSDILENWKQNKKKVQHTI